METLAKILKNSSDIGQKLFRARDYTPVPFLILLLLFERPRVGCVALGCFLMVLGELVRIYSVAFIGGISRTRKGSLGAHLVTDGAFELVRNPLYLGNFFIIMGVSIFSGVPWLMLLGAVFFIVQYYFIVQYEESLLEERFGDEFRNYSLQVPAWIPKRLPDLEDMAWPATFAPALKSEKRTLMAIAAVVVLMVLRA